MQWQIPEPLSIRACQRPQQLMARQLISYPVQLIKLPRWIDNATFQTSPKQKQTGVKQKQKYITKITKQAQLQNEIFWSLQNKYGTKKIYNLIYERGQCKNEYNLNFSFQYVPADYFPLQCINSNRKYQYKPKKGQESQNPSIFSQRIPTSICFDSKFECGNLSKVYQTKDQEDYHLIMQTDVNTLGYTQWYAFSIRNSTLKVKTIQIRIVNFTQRNSLYRKGMKPWYIQEESSAWNPIDSKCQYNRTNVKNSYGQFYYELCFTLYVIPGLNFVAMMPIYSYSRLNSKIQKWISIKGMRLYNKKIYSLINNIVPILEYIPNTNEESQSNVDELKQYDTVIVFARTHPGQVWSSFLMEEFIQAIILFHQSNTTQFRYLLFPMINPDGVIYGNFRCDFSGIDLNRAWIDPSKSTQPSIYNIKKVLMKEFGIKKAKYFIDFHSHSKSLNIFAYTSAQTMVQSRLLSDIIRLSEQNKLFDPNVLPNYISKQFLTQSQTTYLSSKQIFYSKKRSTARAYVSQLTQKGNSMTIQVSFYGYQDRKSAQNQIKVFSKTDFSEFSWCLLKNLHDYINSKQQIVLTKKMLHTIYNLYDCQNSNANGNSDYLQKQYKPNQTARKDNAQDSQSQPQKYYTFQTKKKIKSKNGQIPGFKAVFNKNFSNKGYLKQTESMTKKIQQFNKDKSQENQNQQQKKNKIIENKKENKREHESLQNKKQQSTKILKKPSISQKMIRKDAYAYYLIQNPLQRQQQQNSNIHLNSLPNTSQKIQKINILRKKIIIQTRKKQFRFIKQKKNQNLNTKSNQKRANMKSWIESSLNYIPQPTKLFYIDQTTNHVPVFGNFLTTTKRNVSRRYQSMVREQISTSKNQMLKQDTSPMKQKLKNNLQNKNSSFLEDGVYYDQHLAGSEQAKSGNKNQKEVIQQGSKQNASEQKVLQRTQKKKSQKNQRKLSKMDKPPQQNKYLNQRKKILQMMKKQTHFYREHKKQPISFQDIQQIVQKRKRAKTQFNTTKNHFLAKENNKEKMIGLTNKKGGQTRLMMKKQAYSKIGSNKNQFHSYSLSPIKQ